MIRIPRRHRLLAALGAAGLALGAVPLVGGPASASPGQTVTDLTGGATAEALANELAGSGVTVENVAFTGNDVQAADFTGMGAVGFDSGIVLSTGTAGDVVGPNDEPDTATELGGAGDTDLDTIVAPLTTEDAAVLQFDFVPQSDTVSFEYVFGSEEYTEYVDSEFNDVFAFYVNGTNCATVGSDPVSVNTVNESVNSDRYRDNETDPTAIDTELDGLTTVLTCTATVNAGQTNTLKLAIADTSDQDLDSAVFLRSSSLQAQLPPVCTGASLTTRNDQALAVTLSATDPNGDPLTYTVTDAVDHGTVTGTAPSLTYQANAGYVGADQLVFEATDGINPPCTATIDITVTAPPPPSTTSTVPPRPTPVQATPTFTG